MSVKMRCFETLLEDIEIDRDYRTGHPRVWGLLCPLPVSPILQTVTGQRSVRLRNASPTKTSSDDRPNSDYRSQEYVTLDAIKKAIDVAIGEKHPVDSLNRLRRRIAARLHPDCGLPKSSGEMMSEANALIDHALASLKA